MRTINEKRKLKFAVTNSEQITKFSNEGIARAYAQYCLYAKNSARVALFTLINLQRENRRNVDVVHKSKLAYYRFLEQHSHGTAGLYNVNTDYLEQDLYRCECEVCLTVDFISV